VRRCSCHLRTVRLSRFKANQPTLLARCQHLPWYLVPVADTTRDRAHGRTEHRTLKVVTVGHFGFPHAAQILQVIRKTRTLRTRRWRTMTVYAVTSLGFAKARPARLADLIRGHWAIEAVHHLRDVTFADYAEQVVMPRRRCGLLRVGVLASRSRHNHSPSRKASRGSGGR